jgi:hypothetical protein
MAEDAPVSLFAMISWIATAGIGLYLLSIWLIEYDKEFQAAAATRLPPPLLGAHVCMAFGGLLVWAGYLVFDEDRLAWIATAALGVAVTLGTVMAIRWVAVYKASPAKAAFPLLRQHSQVAVLDRPRREGPPERNFPLPVVVAHGAFATVTIVLVVLTVLGVGGS